MGQTFCDYTFKNDALLDEALTTPSCRMDDPHVRDNQRLEFLGDAVLGLLSAERVFAEFASEPEGALTVRRAQMVSSAALCEAAGRVGLAGHLRRARHVAELPGNSKTMADAVEAVIGAAYLDGGFEAAKRVFDALGISANAGRSEWAANPKGALQVRAQGMKPPRHPEYTLLNTVGPSHAPVFTVRVTVEGMGSAEASAGTHKEAEAQAALRLLQSCGDAGR